MPFWRDAATLSVLAFVCSALGSFSGVRLWRKWRSSASHLPSSVVRYRKATDLRLTNHGLFMLLTAHRLIEQGQDLAAAIPQHNGFLLQIQVWLHAYELADADYAQLLSGAERILVVFKIQHQELNMLPQEFGANVTRWLDDLLEGQTDASATQ